MEYLVQFWNYRLSSGLTAATGLILLWQCLGSKGTLSHVVRWAVILLLSVFVVYMNTLMVVSQPRIRITNLWHIRFMALHQSMGLIYFALLTAISLLGVSMMVAMRYRWLGMAVLRFAHRWAGYAAAFFWLISNIASEIGSRVPRT